MKKLFVSLMLIVGLAIASSMRELEANGSVVIQGALCNTFSGQVEYTANELFRNDL